MNHYTIRKAGPGDLEAVNDLLQQVLSVHHKGRPDLFQETGKKYTDEQLLDIFACSETPVFVYERAGVVLGYAFCELRHISSGSLKPRTTLFIDDICVTEQARGQHIGKALFEYVREFAEEQGCHNITLHVWECNPGAKTFYEALGMTPLYTTMEMICTEGFRTE